MTSMWQSVMSRDQSADGAFVYAVTSTGVYCRPSCPSRRPRREHVAFFDSTGEARRAGYRPCRRCRPDEEHATDRWAEKISRACAYLTRVEGRLSLATLAAHVGGSPYHLQRNFKRIVGVTPREYANAIRLRKMKRLLRRGGDVTDAMVSAGYSSSSRFYERAAGKLGMPPATYRRGGAGITIGYTTTGCPLGRLLVAATPRGVCSVAMGETDTELVAHLRREYPAATIAPDDSTLGAWTAAVVAHLRGTSRQLELPLDIRATAFQWRVWQALSAIPFGETRTYADVARAIGRPRAARAVARACATNPVALASPCHRVVGADGGTGGYRWGADRKKALLMREGQEGTGQRAGRQSSD